MADDTTDETFWDFRNIKRHVFQNAPDAPVPYSDERVLPLLDQELTNLASRWALRLRAVPSDERARKMVDVLDWLSLFEAEALEVAGSKARKALEERCDRDAAPEEALSLRAVFELPRSGGDARLFRDGVQLRGSDHEERTDEAEKAWRREAVGRIKIYADLFVGRLRKCPTTVARFPDGSLPEDAVKRVRDRWLQNFTDPLDVKPESLVRSALRALDYPDGKTKNFFAALDKR